MSVATTSPSGPTRLAAVRAGSPYPAVREDLADLYARLEKTEANTVNLPHRRKYLLLVVGFLRRLLDLHEETVGAVERKLTPKRTRKSRRA